MKEVTLREEEVTGLSQRGLQPGSWRRDTSEGRSASTAEMETGGGGPARMRAVSCWVAGSSAGTSDSGPQKKSSRPPCVSRFTRLTGQRRKAFVSFVFFFFLRYSQAYLLLKEYCSHFTNCCLLVSLLLKNKIHWANLKIELALFNSSWFSQRPIKQGEVCSKEPHKVKGLSSVWFGLGFPLFTVKLLGKWRGHLCCQCLCKNNNFITTLGPEEVCYLKPGTSWS